MLLQQKTNREMQNQIPRLDLNKGKLLGYLFFIAIQFYIPICNDGHAAM